MAFGHVVGIDLPTDDDGVKRATANLPILDEHVSRWAELRDGTGKLQGKWDQGAGVLEIQRRGVKSWYRLAQA